SRVQGTGREVMRALRRGALFAAMAGLFGPGACNVFRTVERCNDSADCPPSYVCDLEGRFCLKLESDVDATDAQDTATDASAEADAPPDLDAPADVDADVDDLDAAPPPCDLTAPFGE